MSLWPLLFLCLFILGLLFLIAALNLRRERKSWDSERREELRDFNE